MKRTIIAGISGAVFAVGLGFAAPTQAAPCSYFGTMAASTTEHPAVYRTWRPAWRMRGRICVII